MTTDEMIDKMWELWKKGLHMAYADCEFVKAERFDAFLSEMEAILTEME